jgi:hypothetical protein
VELLVRIYPEARFLCLYRHPMDVIASGIEACPWGLNGYGDFEQAHPGALPPDQIPQPLKALVGQLMDRLGYPSIPASSPAI